MSKFHATITCCADCDNTSRQIEAFNAALDCLTSRPPRGFKWEAHRDGFLDFCPEDDRAVDAAARQALDAWESMMQAVRDKAATLDNIVSERF